MITFPRSLPALIVLVTSSSFALAADEAGNEDQPPAYWVERLASDDPETRKAAHRALLANYDGIFEPPPFDDADELVQREAFRAALKPLAKQLVKLLDGKHDDSRASAAYLLAVIGPDAAEAEPVLLKFIRSTRRMSPSFENPSRNSSKRGNRLSSGCGTLPRFAKICPCCCASLVMAMPFISGRRFDTSARSGRPRSLPSLRSSRPPEVTTNSPGTRPLRR